MESFLIYIGKAALAAGAFYLAYLALFQNRKQFVFNRFYLPVSLGLSFLIPLITFTTVKYIEAPAAGVNSFALPGSTLVTTQINSAPLTFWPHYLFGLYFLGITGFLMHLLTGHFNAIRIVRQSRSTHLYGRRVHITKRDVHPFSFFNRIVLSENTLNSPNLEMIVAHEKIHVKEKHTLDILFSEILFLLQWFNPFAWLIKDAVKNNLEYKTDHEIVKTNDPQTYQLAMVALAGKKGVAPFLTALNGSQLRNRIIMMKKKTETRFALLKQLFVFPLLAILVMGLSSREVKTEMIQSHPTKFSNSFSGNTSMAAAFSSMNDNSVSDSALRTDKFLISLELNENQFILHGLEGCAFKKLTFSVNENKAVAINQFGMVSAGPGKPGGESDFLFEVETMNNKIKLTGKAGTAWKELIFSPASQKHLINETGVSRTNKNSLPIEAFPNTEPQRNHSDLIPSSTVIDTFTQPLYIVDGRFTKEINQVPPRDIENIRVLKDPSATAIYGSKGKNGVILITTKSKSYKYPSENARIVRPFPQDEIEEPEKMPEFPGGEEALKQYIANNTIYPESEKESGIQGRVVVSFKITKEGKVTGARIARGVHPPMDKEAVRVVSSMPDWKPGRQDGKPVDVSYTVPVDFVLKDYPVKVSRTTQTLSVPKLLYIVDGEVFHGNLDNLNTDEIKRIDVLKGESGTRFYGEQGKNGVVIIQTKNKFNKSLQGKIENSRLESTQKSERMSLKSPAGSKPPLFILNGKEVKTIDDISPQDIERIDVLKEKSATGLYGEKGKNGVIVITTKKYAAQNKITTQLELRKFIAKNIKYPVKAMENNIQETVELWAAVESDGRITRFYKTKPKETVVSLEEVVVVGYATKKRGKRTGEEEPSDAETDDESSQDFSELHSLLVNEVKRVVNASPAIELPGLKGKTIKFRVNFMLQE